MKILLNVKIIKIRKKRNSKTINFTDIQKLNSDIKCDFFNIVYENLNNNLNKCFTEDLNQNKMYRILKIEKDDKKRNIYGLISAGEKGITADLIENNNTTININHKRTLNEYELLKFFFLINIPKANKGFIILQSNARQSIYSSIKDRLYHILNECCKGLYSFDFNKYYTKDELYKILSQAKINDIRFISHDVSNDFADLKNTTSEKCVATTQFARITDDIKYEIFGRNFKKLKKGLHVNGGIEFDVGHGYDDVKVTMTDGNKTRLLSVTQDEFDIDEDVTGNLDFDNDGNPIYSAIKTLAIAKLKNLS